jgi:excisionase family DNA binding protein
MNLINLINEDVLVQLISSEVEKLANIKFEEFKKDLAVNYYFDDCLLNKKEVSKKLNISLRQVDSLVSSRRLKKCAIGRSVKFRNSDVLNYMANLN